MDAAHQLMFALQSPVGLRFGATLQVETDRITFEMDLKIPKGTQCSFRMELSGEDDTIMGTVRIDRVLPARGGSLPRYVCKILEMPTEDRMRFDGWRRDLATGGVSRRLERDPEQLRAQISTKMVGGATEAESRAVLERMDAKRSSRRKEEGYVEGDPLGLATEKSIDKAELREKLREETPVDVEPSAVSAEKAREEMEQVKAEIEKELVVEEAESPSWMPSKADRETSTQAPAAQPTEERAPIPVSAPASIPAVEPKAAPPSPTPAAPSKQLATPSSPSSGEGPGNVSPPIIVVDAESNPIAVTIIYLSDESFIHDYKATLHTSAITIDHPSLTDLYHSVSITIQLADGANISTMGQMVAVVPGGMAIALEFDAVQRAQLTQAAGQ